jgi:hypothetical protein
MNAMETKTRRQLLLVNVIKKIMFQLILSVPQRILCGMINEELKVWTGRGDKIRGG